MPQTLTPPADAVPDRDALRRVGDQVRKRLAANPAVYTIPTDKAEIYAVGDFLSPEECRRVIQMVDRVARPSATFDLGYESEYRTSYSGDVDPHDPFVRKIQRRIDDLLGLDSALGETIQGQRYLPGQQFKAHYDWFDPKGDYWPVQCTHGGQRSYTAMAFLNDVEEGGSTDFTKIGLSVEPKPGALLLWNNADESGVPNEWTMHAGTPVKKGVKYIITKWYRTRPWGRP
ncbi:prolyl hydroxylase family protein [Altericroceibacterium xinjiangense]|uniref:prolyl hydroxylase family protein n=1 Tax=Altericroceibacterium xinjiangense TaxID=762261 RepID=UPI000F7F0E5C|nr:2OG-Fe(II) oxygenase [Altericroceibacterium xinjiangense]